MKMISPQSVLLAAMLLGGVPAFADPQPIHHVQITDIKDAVVYTVNASGMNDPAHARQSIEMAEEAHVDVIIRGWFKWNWAPTLDPKIPEQVHQYGALFGGGITCSVLFEHENNLTHQQALDMSTRGADGSLVPWPLNPPAGFPPAHHASLSSPEYLDYMFRWCRDQIDAGADYLFMDEVYGALEPNEGFDEDSIHDFQTYLMQDDPETSGWTSTDLRWTSQFGIEITNPALCPNHTIPSFDYRAYLEANGFVGAPNSSTNRLASTWKEFCTWRDCRAWKSLADRIHAYAQSKNRRVFLSGNGLFPNVDLQVLNNWKEDEQMECAHQIDLSANEMPYFRSTVVASRKIAGARVPVIIFHDWSATFPWLGVSPAQRCIWMRVRGAEIYAAGGFFAFPLQAPGENASLDGTMPTIIREAAFYQLHRDLYLNGHFLGANTVMTDAPNLSLAVWSAPDASKLLVHVINRDFTGGQLHPRKNVVIRLPTSQLPVQADAISPDWAGQKSSGFAIKNGKLELTLKNLDAYAVVTLRFSQPIPLDSFRDK